MQRVAFRMHLKAGVAAQYQKRHDEIWPKLIAALEAAGVSDYTIYLDKESGNLFAFQRLRDHNRSEQLAELPVVKEWWASMADLMDTNDDNSPVCVGLNEVFHMD